MLAQEAIHPAIRFFNDADFDCMIRAGTDMPTVEELVRWLPTGKVVFYCEKSLNIEDLQAKRPLLEQKQYSFFMMCLGQLPPIELLMEAEFQSMPIGICIPSDKPSPCRWFPWQQFDPQEQIERLRKLSVLNFSPFVAANPMLINNASQYAQKIAQFTNQLFILDEASSEAAATLRKAFNSTKKPK